MKETAQGRRAGRVPRWAPAAAVLSLPVLLAAVAWSFQFREGMAVTGLNRPALWGTYIVTVLFLVRRRKALQEDVAKARRLHAPRAARAGLESAATAFKARDNIRFYEAVWDTLASYYGNLLNLPPGEITLDRVSEALGRAGMSAHDLSRLREMFIVCEHARFGLHVHGNLRMTDSDVHNAGVIMDTLEDVIQRSEKTGVAA